MFKLETFTSRKDARVGHKIGILGSGQYGGKIADLFAGVKDGNNKGCYDVIAVNSFAGDLKPLKNISKERKYCLLGVENGCGRKPELAKEALQIKENQTKLMELVKNYMNDNDMYIIAAGLGGGTGTGTVQTMIKVIHSIVKNADKKKPIGAIVTLPRTAEPLAEKKNALNAIKELEELMNSNKTNFKFIIYVDNQKAFTEFKDLKADNSTKFDNWMDYSNYKVVSILHEINVATRFSSDKTFDPQDLNNVFTEWEGAMTFGKYKFPAQDLNSSDELIKKTIETFHEGNVLANGFDLKKTRTAGVLIVKPENNKIITSNSLDDIEETLSKEMPLALYRPTGYVEWANPDDAIIYTIAKVAELPKRAREELNDEYTEALKKVKEDIKNTKLETKFDDVDDSIFGDNDSSRDNEEDFDPFATDILDGKMQEVEEDDSDPFEN